MEKKGLIQVVHARVYANSTETNMTSLPSSTNFERTRVFYEFLILNNTKWHFKCFDFHMKDEWKIVISFFGFFFVFKWIECKCKDDITELTPLTYYSFDVPILYNIFCFLYIWPENQFDSIFIFGIML